jgi:selenocysteine lyase/cysteine desulfurase
MTIDRRRLLASLAASAAGAKLLPFAAGAEPVAATAASSATATFRLPDGSTDWGAVRAEFDGLKPDWIHLSSFLFVSHPRAVRAEIERFRAKLDSDPYWIEAVMYEGEEGEPYERARRALADYLGGSPDELAFTSNTTSSIAVFYHGLRIRPDQEILTTEHDHFVHHEAIDYSVARSGASVRKVRLFEKAALANGDEIVARIEKAIAPKTRVLGVTWVQSSTGVRLPIGRIAEAVARANRGRADADRCLLFVDGVHGFGNQDVDAAKLGGDFFAAGAHKWFHGPRGTGFLWGRKELWKELRLTFPTFDPQSVDLFEAAVNGLAPGPTRAPWMSPGGFLAYEHFLALPAAAELHRAIGRDRIAARIAELNGQIRAGLSKIAGVTLHTPLDPALAAGINCFEVAGMSVGQTVTRLKAKKIRATTSPYAVSYARFAAGIMNEPGEIDRGVAAVRELARG